MHGPINGDEGLSHIHQQTRPDDSLQKFAKYCRHSMKHR
jgi:hypothetical protein